jgi:hypothetical protein
VTTASASASLLATQHRGAADAAHKQGLIQTVAKKLVEKGVKVPD